MELNKQNIKKICIIVAFGVGLYWLLQNISIIGDTFSTVGSIIFPFILGACIAFVLNIPMTIIEKKWLKDRKSKNGRIKKTRWKRPVSIILSIVIVIGIIALLINYIVPELINVINIFISRIPDTMEYLQTMISDLMNNYSNVGTKIMELEIDFESISNDAIEMLKNLGTSIVSSSFGIVINVLSGIVTFFVAIIFSIYILLNKEKLARQVKKLIYAYFSEEKANGICNFSSG